MGLEFEPCSAGDHNDVLFTEHRVSHVSPCA